VIFVTTSGVLELTFRGALSVIEGVSEQYLPGTATMRGSVRVWFRPAVPA
jgi:hypothetical protein